MDLIDLRLGRSGDAGNWHCFFCALTCLLQLGLPCLGSWECLKAATKCPQLPQTVLSAKTKQRSKLWGSTLWPGKQRSWQIRAHGTSQLKHCFHLLPHMPEIPIQYYWMRTTGTVRIDRSVGVKYLWLIVYQSGRKQVCGTLFIKTPVLAYKEYRRAKGPTKNV